MAEPYLGEIRMFAGNFAPRNWALCDGGLLDINQYQSLFSLLGTTYGGDGRTTFALPDLRGRTPIGMGDGPSTSDRSHGQKGGSEEVILTENEVPVLTGNIHASTTIGTSSNPTGNYLAHHSDDVNAYGATSNTSMAKGSITINEGGGQAHSNMQPYQTLNFIIALEGTYPPRN